MPPKKPAAGVSKMTEQKKKEKISEDKTSGGRKSVFAEAYDPENDLDEDEGATAIFPKTDDQRSRLVEPVKNILLFRSLDKEQMNQVSDAMFEKKKVQPGEYIIRQGDDGDNVYVIESGKYKAIVGDNHIHTYDNSGSFGEFALLCNHAKSCNNSSRNRRPAMGNGSANIPSYPIKISTQKEGNA